MICGAIWSGALPTAPLTGVADVLSPYGKRAASTCSIGDWSAEVSAFDNSMQSLAHSPAGAIVCADVFLHDRAALCRRLGSTEHVSDVELIALAYDRWERDLCRHLSGSFAIAVLDERCGGVFLARDHSGAKFLALHQREDAVAFASTSLALTGFPGVGHALDSQRLSELAIAGYGTTRTFVSGVQSLAPGSSFWMDRGDRLTKRWWEPERLEVNDEGSLETHAAALRTEFERSVGAVLRGVAAPGVLLSGGLDSGSIAAVAGRQLAPRPLRSYTSVPPSNWSGRVPRGWVADEREAVNAIGRKTTNLRSRFVDLEGRPLFDHQRDLWELGGGPDRNPLNAVWEHECVREAAADGVDVLLLGASGNHGFSADGPLWLAEFRRRRETRTDVFE